MLFTLNLLTTHTLCLPSAAAQQDKNLLSEKPLNNFRGRNNLCGLWTAGQQKLFTEAKIVFKLVALALLIFCVQTERNSAIIWQKTLYLDLFKLVVEICACAELGARRPVAFFTCKYSFLNLLHLLYASFTLHRTLPCNSSPVKPHIQSPLCVYTHKQTINPCCSQLSHYLIPLLRLNR